MLGSMKARLRAASDDVTLASSSIYGAEYVQQANVRYQHVISRASAHVDRNPKKRLVDSHKNAVIQQQKSITIFSNSFVRRSTGQMQMKLRLIALDCVLRKGTQPNW